MNALSWNILFFLFFRKDKESPDPDDLFATLKTLLQQIKVGSQFDESLWQQWLSPLKEISFGLLQLRLAS